MDTQINKFYDGYEGEPEIQFIREFASGDRVILSIWDGFFDDIMCQFKASSSVWHGLAYYYHLGIGWENGEQWEISDILAVTKEFQILDTTKFRFPKTAEALSAINALLASALKENQKVWINKD